VRRLIAGALVASAVLAAPGAADASTARVPCWGGGSAWDFAYAVKPRLCMFNGDEAHAYQVPLRKMRWRSWGGRTACGRGEFFYNMGYHAPARFCLYRRARIDGGLLIYAAIRGVIGRGCTPYDGCFGKPTHFRSQTG